MRIELLMSIIIDLRDDACVVCVSLLLGQSGSGREKWKALILTACIFPAVMHFSFATHVTVYVSAECMDCCTSHWVFKNDYLAEVQALCMTRELESAPSAALGSPKSGASKSNKSKIDINRRTRILQ